MFYGVRISCGNKDACQRKEEQKMNREPGYESRTKQGELSPEPGHGDHGRA